MITLAILQARFNSSRLPGKALKSIVGKPMLQLEIERIQRAKKIDKFIVATSIESSDDGIVSLCRDMDIECFRGSLNDVLDRFYQVAKIYKPANVVRLTGDCPLIDPEILDKTIELHLNGEFDYVSNDHPPTYPDGLDVEIMTMETLKTIWLETKLLSQREHVTLAIYQQPERFKLGVLQNPENLSYLRWTVDQQEDFKFVSEVYEALYPANKNFLMTDILKFITNNPQSQEKNLHYQRNAGLQKSLQNDLLFIVKDGVNTCE